MTPTVFVHGNPETAAIWGPLLAALPPGREYVTLSPPGFGAPVPDGFGATWPEYRDWLVGELEGFGEPVHLVGHDWGGAHVLIAAMARPDLVRSWVSDVVGVFHPDYVWHEFAQRWQTPGVGEQAVQQLLGRTGWLVGAGVPQDVADRIAAGQDADMARAVLRLYRSAAQPAVAELGRDLPRLAGTPGLAVVATEDDLVGTPEMHHGAAAGAGARVTVLDGLGHFWAAQDPATAARELTAFWDGAAVR